MYDVALLGVTVGVYPKITVSLGLSVLKSVTSDVSGAENSTIPEPAGTVPVQVNSAVVWVVAEMPALLPEITI